MLILLVVVHIFGTRINRSKAKAWIRAHAPVLRSEFAVVGFDGIPHDLSLSESEPTSSSLSVAETDALLRQQSLSEYFSYATGRVNIAFADINVTFTKKHNILVNAIEQTIGYFMDGYKAPHDMAEVVLYPFDGREALIVPSTPGSDDLRAKDRKSSYDNFVFAIVNKVGMQRLRDSRFDVSLTITKDHAKLPEWATVMSENAEITDIVLTPELVNAITMAGPVFEHIIITDQPSEKPDT